MLNSSSAEKRHKKLKKESWEQNEPDFNILDYDHSMLINLNYYSQEVDPKIKQEWSLQYLKSIGKSVDGLDKLTPSCFNQIGALVRLQNRNVNLIETHKRYILNKHKQLMELIPEKEESPKVEVVAKKPKSEEPSKQLVLILIELDTQLDNILLRFVEYSNIKKLFLNFKLSKTNLSSISSEYGRVKKHFTDILNSVDEDTVESYSNIPKKNIKMAIRFCDDILESCKSKTKISIRKKKEKPASVLAAKVKYLKEFPDLKLISLTPDKIISSSEAWFYNTKLRKVFKYKSIDGMNLTIKGTTLLNWDSELSGSKTIRKPEEFFKSFQSSSKSNINKLYFDIKCIIGNPTGRINSDMVILKVF